MLYTTYLSNVKYVPAGVEIFFIARYVPPKWSNPFPRMIELAPGEKIFTEYLRDKDWDKFEKSFLLQTEEEGVTHSKLEELLVDMKCKDRNICIVCYEKDHTKCHRGIVGNWFAERGVKCFEIQKGGLLLEYGSGTKIYTCGAYKQTP